MKYLDDIFYWLGALLVSAGAYFIYPAFALIVFGFYCSLFSYLIGKAKANQ